MRALVIDDSRVTRMVLSRMLQALGFEVAEAEDGRQGLEELRRHPPAALALVDGNMPDMDGWALVKAVRADPAYASVRLLLVTGEQKSAEIQRALADGADGYLAKPFTREDVVGQLRRLGLWTGDV
jgi:two-component system, chemotaxis family, chemotaxis protein CheY